MGKIDVYTKSLIADARERYEDSYTCDMLAHYITFCADVPAYAWGNFQWSGRWSKDWATACDARETEARSARDVQSKTAGALYQVAADYAHTDIDVSLTFDISDENAALRPWLKALHGSSNGPTVHPGGDFKGPKPYDGGDLNVPAPDATGRPSDIASRMHYAFMDHGWNQAEITTPGTVTPRMKMRQVLGNTPGYKALWKFINDHYSQLTQAEEILGQYGKQPDKLPSRDFIDDAKDAVPGVIINRAELIGVAKNEYDELKGNLIADTNDLKADWYSPGGATSYFIHANKMITYYGDISGQANWLHNQGGKAGKAIDALMLAYANVGYDKIKHIIDTLEAYKDALGDFTGNLDDPVKALASAVNAFSTALLSEWRKSNSDAQSTLQINQAASSHAPDLGDSTHGAVPYPEDGVPNNSWKHADNWHPQKKGGPPSTAN